MSLEYWKAQAKRWKKAYWASLNDSEDERNEILHKAREKAKASRIAKAKVKLKTKKTVSKKPTKKPVKKTFKPADLFSF